MRPRSNQVRMRDVILLPISILARARIEMGQGGIDFFF